MAKGLIAEFRYGHTAHARATKLGDAWWFRVRMGKARMITCDCGGQVKYMPDALEYDDSWVGCSHIVALFKGTVTDDKRVETRDYTVTRGLWDPLLHRPHFARLTQLGERMFHWRWTARAL